MNLKIDSYVERIAQFISIRRWGLLVLVIATPLLFTGINRYFNGKFFFSDFGDYAEITFEMLVLGGIGIYLSRIIARRTQLIEELRRSEERYRSLFENMPEGLAHCQMFFEDGKPQDFIYLDVNGSFERLTGLKNVVGKKVTEVIPGIRESNPGLFEIYGRVALTGNPERFETYVDSLGIWFSISVYSSEREYFVAVFDNVTDRKHADEQLREGETRYRTLFESAGDCIYIVDAEGDRPGRIVSANPAAAELHGYTVEEMLSLHMDELDTPESAKKLQSRIERVLKGETVKEETTHRRKDGTVFPLEINARLLELGSHKYALAIDRDITDRRKMDAALKEIQGQQKALLDNIPDMAWLKDKECRFVAVNKPFGNACGVAPENLRGKTDLDIWPFELAERYRADDRAVMASGNRKRVEEPLTDKDGNTIWIETIKTPIHNDVGENIGTTGIARDVTAWKRAEEELVQAKHDWEETFDSITDAITVHDKDFNIIRCNKAAEKMLGLPDSLIPREHKCYRYYHGTDAPPGECPSCRCLETGEQAIFENFEPHLNKHVEIRAIPRFDNNGQLTGLIHVVRDITDRKRAAEEKATLELQLRQSQKMEAIGTLAGGVAHDFNNLLTVVLGFSELLLIDKDERNPAYADLQKINQAARNGADLVKRILTFSRKVDTNLHPLNLNHEIEQTKKLLTRTIPKMVAIELVLSDELATVNADPTQVEQILLNLAVNAKDAMPDGGKLTLETADVSLDEEYARTHLGAKPGEYVLLSVSDTGHGMDKETLDHIFEPFFTTKEAGKGTGLGLAMVYGIVHQHGGYITCYSEPGEGTTFKMYFPIMEMEIDQDVTTSGEMPAFGTETILLVDDEEFIRDLGKRILERSGYTVLTAANGKEALDLYKREKEKISLVILDLIMPEMGGKQCLEELLKIAPEARVLIASGFAADGQTKEALETGAKGFVGKPYNMKEMPRVIRKVLDGE